MLVEFGADIWIADGPVVTGAAGFPYPTRMALIRLPGNALIAWSPIALTPELRAAIERLGDVAYILPPNSLHHSFLTEWQQAYPQAAILAPPALREKRADIRFSGDLAAPLPLPMQSGIEVALFSGNAITEEAVFFHRQSGTILFADLLQQLPRNWFRGWRAVVARLDLMTGKEAQVPRKFRVAFKDRLSTRRTVGTIVDWPSRAIVIAHGPPIVGDTRNFLRRAFKWL